MMTKKELEFAFFLAGTNWIMWRDCFEEQSVADLPVLCDNDRFKRFVSDYSLLRNLKQCDRDRLCNWMKHNDRMEWMIADESGGRIDRVLDEMQKPDPGFRSERSFLSKLAAFARPEVFIAYDRFASRGVRKLLFMERNPQDYVDYLGKVRQFCRKPSVSEEIAGYIADRHIPACNKKAFRLRMLDVYLMLKGGRWCRCRKCQLVTTPPCSHMPCR